MEVTINNELKLIYPEGFHELTEEERSNLRFIEEGPGLCLSDPERHIMVTVGWKQPGMMALLVLSAGDIAKNMEKTVRRAMQETDYHLEGFGKRQIAGEKAEGFRYGYCAQDIRMLGESYAMKYKKSIYYFNLYAREKLREDSFPVWEEMLGLVRKI